MEKKFAAVFDNLVVTYEEIKLFALLPQVYPQDFVDFIAKLLKDTINPLQLFVAKRQFFSQSNQ